MSGHTSRYGSETQNWEGMDPKEVLEALVHEIYAPVSLLGNQLNRITADNDPITEDDYEAIFEQMQQAVVRLSKTVVRLRKYVHDMEGADQQGA